VSLPLNHPHVVVVVVVVVEVTRLPKCQLSTVSVGEEKGTKRIMKEE
jgi:hypothetical protein